MNTMPNWLRQRAFLTPARIAFETETVQLTFHQLDDRVMSIGKQLAQAGVQEGGHVAVLLRNSIDMVCIIHALSYIGAVAVLLNTRLSQAELRWQMQDADVSHLVTEEEYRAFYYVTVPSIYTVDELQALPKKECKIREEFQLDKVMTIMYTSGTTGKPKGVMLTYGNHWWSAVGSALNLGVQDRDCWLACLPFFHVGGLSILLKNIIYGIRVLFLERPNPLEINKAIQTRGVTIISVVAKVLTDMLRELGEDIYPKTLRCVLLGGGPAPRPLLDVCMRKGVPVYQTYGMTETASQVCTLSVDYMLTKVGSAGKPLYPCQIRIEANGIEALRNSAGEIVVKGPNVTKGYLKREEATKEGIRNDWLYTGDIGYIDEDGFLYVLDRRSDLIISGGENIYPAQVEEVLLAHPAVIEAGVIAKDDKEWGQVPVAFVNVVGEITEDELISFCYNRLARYKAPKQIMFVDALPRNASNKIMRHKLKELL